MGATESCATTCGSMGTRTCNGTCDWDACAPPIEACNGVDDDCDDITDEGCGICGSCTGATTVNAPGGRFTQTLEAATTSGTCGGGGSQLKLTITLAEESDLFVTTHGSGNLDTVVYVRDCECSGTELSCADDSDGLITSTVQLTALPAGTYNIFADTKTPMSASVTVDVYATPSGPEAENCGRPLFIPRGAPR